MANSNAWSVFLGDRTIRPVCTDVCDILSMFKDEGVQVTFLPCFTEVYNRMFHLAKRVTTGTTWEALPRQEVIISTDIDNIDNIVVADWRGFMVVCPEERPGAEIGERPSYFHILVTEQVVATGSRRYIAECLYSRHSNGVYYVCNTEALTRALYEFCFIHFRTMNPHQRGVCMSDMKTEVSKSMALQQRLHTMALSHMDNSRKDVEEIYFTILGYDITLYSKHAAELARATDPNNEWEQSNDEGTADVQRSEDDTSAILEMQKDMDRLLNVFMETEAMERQATNRWRVRTFNELAAYAAVDSDSDYEYRTDSLFRNMPARVAYDLFIGVVPEAGLTTSIIGVARADDWMTCVVEDLKRRLKGVRRGA